MKDKGKIEEEWDEEWKRINRNSEGREKKKKSDGERLNTSNHTRKCIYPSIDLITPILNSKILNLPSSFYQKSLPGFLSLSLPMDKSFLYTLQEVLRNLTATIKNGQDDPSSSPSDNFESFRVFFLLRRVALHLNV